MGKGKLLFEDKEKKDIIISPLPAFQMFLGEEQWLFRMSPALLKVATDVMQTETAKACVVLNLALW